MKRFILFIILLFVCNLSYSATRVVDMVENATPTADDITYCADGGVLDRRCTLGAMMPLSGWTDGGSDIYLTDGSDKVGIGTTAPAYALDVSGIINSNQGITINGVDVCLSDNTNCYPVAPGGWTDGGAVVYATSTGDNVGIGTINPLTKLHVKGEVTIDGSTSGFLLANSMKVDGDDTNKLTFSQTEGSNNENIRFDLETTANTLGIDSTTGVVSVSAPGISFATGGLTSTSSLNVGPSYGVDENPPMSGALIEGNVGIGTFVVTSALQVAGTVTATSFVGDGSGLTGISGGSGGWNDGGTNVYLSTTTDNVGIGTTTPTSGFKVDVRGNQYVSGNVGVGTTITYSTLDVGYGRSPIVATGGMQASFGSNIAGIAGIEMQNLNSGTASEYRFLISDDPLSNNNYIAFSMPSSGNTSTLFGITRSTIASVFTGATGSGSGRTLALGTVKANDIVFGTNNSENMRIKSGGNIGIGTSYPQTKLQVSGDTKVGNGTFSNTSANEDLYVEGNLEVDGTLYGDGSQLTGISAGGWVDGGTNIYASPTTDNVAIGTTTPTQKLTVVGTVSATAFVGDGSGITGLSAGAWTDGGTNIYPATTSDQVAIGTTTPVAGSILTVNGTIAGGGSGDVRFTGSNVGIGTSTAKSTLLYVSTTGGTVDSASTGDVYIQNDLEVDGTVYMASCSGAGCGTAGGGWVDGGTNIYASPTTDNVGIGTTTPTSGFKLDVRGNSYFLGNIGIGTTVTNARLDLSKNTDTELVLKDTPGENFYNSAQWDGKNYRIYHGSTANPVTTAGPTFKISRGESVASATCGSNPVDSECNAALSVVSAGAATSGMQTAAIAATALTAHAQDAVALWAIGSEVSGGSGKGTGAYLEGGRNDSSGTAVGAEIRISNDASADDTYETTQISDTSGLWITTNSTGGYDSAEGIGFGAIGSSQFVTGIGFKAGSVKTDSIKDDSSSTNAIHIAGTHTNALIALSGNVGIGTSTVPEKLYVRGSSTGNIAAYLENTNSGGITSVRVANSADNGFRMVATGSGYAVPNAYGMLVTTGEKLIFGEEDGTMNVTIDGSGNVGIGSTSPGVALDVGTGAVRIGIGTITPGTMLCVKNIANSRATIGYCTGSVTGNKCGTCN